MCGEQDMNILATQTYVASFRPRGIISGFLAVIPSLGFAVFLPPVASRTQPFRIRMRLDSNLYEEGAVFSAYVTGGRANQSIVVEDILVFKGKSVWFTSVFQERWAILKDFLGHMWQPDTVYQGIPIRFASYVPLDSLSEATVPDDTSVIEFVPNATNQKRLIWIPPKAAPVASATQLTARKETGSGPDVFMIYRGSEKLGQALVRTLAISKELRAAFAAAATAATTNEVAVNAVQNRQFDKWEILGLYK
jgi:hypothetical protein